eukprot:6230635-Alexandrium_andersonii.AAC.1
MPQNEGTSQAVSAKTRALLICALNSHDSDCDCSPFYRPHLKMQQQQRNSAESCRKSPNSVFC